MENDNNKKNERKRKSRIKAQPLEYWEELSCMLAVIKEGFDPMPGILGRLENIPGIEIEKSFSEDGEGGLHFVYDGEKYAVQFSMMDFTCPDLEYMNTSLSEAEKQVVQRSQAALSVAMPLHGDIKECYHLQLRLIYAMVPQLAALFDESAERVFSPRFVKMSALSDVPPAPACLYSVQAVSDESSDKVWLHTHGLCRCGLTELEILDSDKENCDNHYNLISVLANRMLDFDEEDENSNSDYIGRLRDGRPVVPTAVPGEEAIWEYGRRELGGMRDRENGHNTRTSVIFLFTSEEDEENGILTKVDIYNNLWGDNPMFLLSTKETNRMAAAARERFRYLEKCTDQEQYAVIIKLGLPTKGTEEIQNEHIWFELISLEGDGKFRASLSQEPYYLDMKVGDEGLYSVDQVTDWRIFCEDGLITPDEAYRLMEE